MWEALEQCKGYQFGHQKTFLPPSLSSALTILNKEYSSGILTFCKAFDQYIEGGIPLCSISEFHGAPGSGKTQLCLQLCVDVQLPHAFHGIEGQAVYISTDSGFSFTRLSEIAEAFVNHCQMIANKSGDHAMISSMLHFSVDSIMKNIFYINCSSYLELQAEIIHLKEFLEGHRVKLIVIDNMTVCLHDIANSLHKSQALYELLGQLEDFACSHEIAIVITNHLTTKLEPGKESNLVSALGDSFGHRVHFRFMLAHMNRNDFFCIPVKYVNKAAESIFFKITKAGIKDARNVASTSR